MRIFVSRYFIKLDCKAENYVKMAILSSYWSVHYFLYTPPIPCLGISLRRLTGGYDASSIDFSFIHHSFELDRVSYFTRHAITLLGQISVYEFQITLNDQRIAFTQRRLKSLQHSFLQFCSTTP